ncbi:Nicotianamine synthase [Linum perenne]
MGVCLKQQQEEEVIVNKVLTLYEKISNLNSLKPSKDVDMLFTQLVSTCIPPSPIDVNNLTQDVQQMRSKLIQLCGEAEAHLESHFSTILASFNNPIDHLHIFPYYSNYLKLSHLEFTLLNQSSSSSNSDLLPYKRVAFIGSGPLPLTSIVLATKHLTTTCFHNYDIDSSANAMALNLVSSHPDLSKRIFFHTADVMDLTHNHLKDFDVVFLAALVGMDKEMKLAAIRHLGNNMAAGSILMLRSAHGARGFLYPVVDSSDLHGFELLSVFHPTDEVINSVVIARKLQDKVKVVHHHHDQQSSSKGSLKNNMIPCKCSEIAAAFKPLNNHHGCMMMEELTVEEQLS